MQQAQYVIESICSLNHRTVRIDMSGPADAISAPGQFVNILVDGKYLRRPISVADWHGHSLTLLVDIVGEGTEWLASCMPGQSLDVLTGLGNGFSTDIQAERPLLISGGIGIAPLLGLGRQLIAEGKKPVAVVGFNESRDAAAARLLAEAGIECHVATMKGDHPEGFHGNAIDAAIELTGQPEYFYACGPLPMMKALCQRFDADGQLSLDARMGCGFGACMCCSVRTADGPKRICKEGPVFTKSNLIWQ